MHRELFLQRSGHGRSGNELWSDDARPEPEQDGEIKKKKIELDLEGYHKGPRRTGPAYLGTRRGGEGRARRYHECGRTTHPNEAKASLGMSPVDILEKEPS